jgi:hypothetical protein
MSSTALSEPTILRKSYSRPYVLDRGKLSRILTIGEQRLTEAAGSFSPNAFRKFAAVTHRTSKCSGPFTD